MTTQALDGGCPDCGFMLTQVRERMAYRCTRCNAEFNYRAFVGRMKQPRHMDEGTLFRLPDLSRDEMRERLAELDGLSL